MQSIEQALPQNRYLIIAGRISAAEWQRIVETVNSALIENRPSRAISEVEIERTMINKPLSATQLPIYSYGCYADIPPEYAWDTLFNLDDSSIATSTKAVSCFGVYFQRGVLKQLQHGHQADVVLDFPCGIPDLLAKLPVVDGRNWRGRAELALCRSDDLAAIQAHRDAR